MKKCNGNKTLKISAGEGMKTLSVVPGIGRLVSKTVLRALRSQLLVLVNCTRTSGASPTGLACAELKYDTDVDFGNR